MLRRIDTGILVAVAAFSAACVTTRKPAKTDAASASMGLTGGTGGTVNTGPPMVVRAIDEKNIAEQDGEASSRPTLTQPPQDDGPPAITPAAAALIPEDRRITLTVPDASAGELARMLGKAADVNVIVDEGLDKHGALDLRDVSARDAFQALASRFQLRMDTAGSILLISDANSPRRIRKILHVQASDLTDLESTLKPVVGNEGTVSVAAPSKTVFVEASADRIRQVENILASLALQERQVLIEANLYEVSFDDRLEWGAALDLQIDFGSATAAVVQNLLPTANNFQIAAANDAGTLAGTIRALQTISSLELLSAPRIATLNGQDASIEVIREVPYVQSTNSVAQNQAGGGVASVQEVLFKEAGITLKVKPTVMPDGTVRLDVLTKVAQVVAFFIDIPVIDTRTLQSIVFIDDGGTFFLGGLVQREIIDIEKKVPFLGDIPLLGLLFKQIDQQVRRKELLVTLTVRVFDDKSAEGLTHDFQMRYRAEKAAMEKKRGGSILSENDVPPPRD